MFTPNNRQTVEKLIIVRKIVLFGRSAAAKEVIAKLIKEYIPNYKLTVRRHKAKHVETVLYAWLEE